jgi:hypothetical protein
MRELAINPQQDEMRGLIHHFMLWQDEMPNQRMIISLQDEMQRSINSQYP